MDRAGRRKLGAAGLWTLINLPAVVVLLRSGSGNLQPLSSGGVTSLAFLLAAISLVASSLWASVEEPCEEFRDLLWRKVWQGFLSTFPLAVIWDTSVPTAAPFAAAVTISLSVTLLTTTLLGRWWAFTLPIPLPAILASPIATPAPALQTVTSDLVSPKTWQPEFNAEEDAELEAEDDAPALQNASQWQTRNAAEGHEVIEGVTLARMPAGQKQLQLHIAFCPPLPSPPQVEHDFPDGTPVRCKVAAAYSYGIRLELRRSGETSEPLEFAVHYTAWAGATAAADSAA